MKLNSFFNICYPLYDVDDVVDPPKTDMDILNEDDTEEDKPEDDDTDDTTSDDEEEEDTKKDKDDEVDEEEIVRLNWPKLKEKYPELAKDPEFKVLKNTIYREQEFTKYFPDPKDAEVALAAQGNYEDLKDMVISGNTDQLLQNIGEVSEKSLDTFASNFLPSLRTVNDKLYAKVTTPVIKNVLRAVLQYGEEHDHKETGKNFINAARVVSKLVFNTDELGRVEEGTKPAKDDELDQDKQNYYAGKHKELLDTLSTEVDKSMDTMIGDIDPTGVLKDRPKLKAKILNEIKSEIREALGNDKGHLSRIDALWARERRSGFSGALKDSIKTTFLSRARVLMPEIRKRVRADYLGSTKDTDTKLKNNLDGRDKNIPPGRNVSGSGKKIPTAKEAKEKGITAKQLLDMD